ncbi:MAG: hypothetical protein ACRC1T_05050 [Clostridium chrysemydis]|uniref:hypothetical protein n=1 Tax=Clostridium chrysemydis TaxID=2665504 RepID=UPI003F320043
MRIKWSSKVKEKPKLKMIRSKENGDLILIPIENYKKDASSCFTMEEYKHPSIKIKVSDIMLKVGDKVKIREDLIVGEKYGVFTFSELMSNFKGKETIIEGITHKNDKIYENYDLNIDNRNFCWTKEMLEKVEEEDNHMKELTFKEVIANIKEDEVWEATIKKNGNYVKKIWMKYNDLRIENNEPRAIWCLDEEIRYKLQRPQYTFQEAFKSFEEGKEIESTSGTKYKYDKTSFEVSIIESQCENRATIYCFEDTLFRCDEIQGKWYIND